MLLKSLCGGILFGALSLIHVTPVFACIHEESDNLQGTRPLAQEYLLVHGDGQEVLVISTEIGVGEGEGIVRARLRCCERAPWLAEHGAAPHARRQKLLRGCAPAAAASPTTTAHTHGGN